jgi:hypothetical protein
MPRRKRQRARKRRCIYCDHEEPAHFSSCRLATAQNTIDDFFNNFEHVKALARRVKKPALSLIVDNTKENKDA